MSNEICPVCNDRLTPSHQAWNFQCNSCGYEKSSFVSTINSSSAHQLIDEEGRGKGLKKLRVGNFRRLLRIIKSLKPSGGKLLDVGSAHGWFLEEAANDFDVVGLEPDEQVFKRTLLRGLPVRMGYFPDALHESEKFDVIVFNDVIEHISNIKFILASCHQRLNHEGLLILNLPSSSGIFYRISKVFCRFGFLNFFERLWQKDLPSPHLHYFNSSNIVELLENNGFETLAKGRLPTLHLSGIYSRVSYTGNLSTVVGVCVSLGAVLLLPVLWLLPSDIIYVVARPK